MNQELIEYLRIVEMKLQSLMQDIQNIRNRLDNTAPHTPLIRCHQLNFFNALQAEDNAEFNANPANMGRSNQ